MKKILTIISLMILGVCMSGCSEEKITWKLNYIQDSRSNVIYCSEEEYDLYEDVEIKDMDCVLDGESITITDKLSKEKWTGKLKAAESTDKESDIYNVIFDTGNTGMIVESFTEYKDGDKVGTVIMSSGGYTLNFTEDLGK